MLNTAQASTNLLGGVKNAELSINSNGQTLIKLSTVCSLNFFLSHDVAFGSDIMPCNKIDKPLVV